MEDLEEKIQAVLADPQQLEQIAAMARSLGLELPEGALPSEEAPGPGPMPDLAQLAGPMAKMLQAGKLDKRQEDLFNALKPFLRPERREKMDRALQVARLSHLAGAALNGRSEKKT